MNKFQLYIVLLRIKSGGGLDLYPESSLGTECFINFGLEDYKGDVKEVMKGTSKGVYSIN